jgi:predicted DNA-binding transcriptional regulator AlpA
MSKRFNPCSDLGCTYITPAESPVNAVPASLQNFDQLPAAAEVRLPTVCGFYAQSAATVWRGVKAGRIPAPRKYSPGCTTWNVGELRAAKAEVAAQ